ncbi:hypothetical protein ACFPM0_25365 [Pseudonocardia sulfidoxydans]|uniref:hypothetical protein n=1 Tax=Pseudonocardia sulfidoxydans TaxID=54011 RepID=UPI00360B8E20
MGPGRGGSAPLRGRGQAATKSAHIGHGQPAARPLPRPAPGRQADRHRVPRVRRQARPAVHGDRKVGSVDADVLDSLYAELRRCREHCTTRRGTDHRTPRPHDCDDRCRPHKCRPLGNATIRKIHYVLSGAYKKAIRWRWVATSPMDQPGSVPDGVGAVESGGAVTAAGRPPP